MEGTPNVGDVMMRKRLLFHIFERDLASLADFDVHHVPPTIRDFAVVFHMELHGVFAHTVQRDLQAQRVKQAAQSSTLGTKTHLRIAVFHGAAAERVHLVPAAA